MNDLTIVIVCCGQDCDVIYRPFFAKFGT